MMSPMSQARLEEIGVMVADCSGAERCTNPEHAIRNELFDTLKAAVVEIHRGRDAYAKLAACIGRLDFDRTEAALPETQDAWIEFVRELDERAQELTEAEETEREKEAGSR